MSKLTRIVVPMLAFACLLAAPALAGEHRIGVGYRYFTTVDQLHVDNLSAIDDNGNSVVFSYQYLPGGLLRFEGDLEYYSGGYGGSTEKAYSPQAYVLIGRGFYGGVGIGATRSNGFPNGDQWTDPWYAARVGLDLLLLPKIHLDINANYRANAFSQLDNAKSDAITLGASVRVSF